jgi:hypothetical protein
MIIKKNYVVLHEISNPLFEHVFFSFAFATWNLRWEVAPNASLYFFWQSKGPVVILRPFGTRALLERTAPQGTQSAISCMNLWLA